MTHRGQVPLCIFFSISSIREQYQDYMRIFSAVSKKSGSIPPVFLSSRIQVYFRNQDQVSTALSPDLLPVTVRSFHEEHSANSCIRKMKLNVAIDSSSLVLHALENSAKVLERGCSVAERWTTTFKHISFDRAARGTVIWLPKFVSNNFNQEESHWCSTMLST
jgi:hypothetical protein